MKEKPLTEKRIREIVREEIAKIPPTYVPVPYPQPNPTPATPYQPNYPNPYHPNWPITTYCLFNNPLNPK